MPCTHADVFALTLGSSACFGAFCAPGKVLWAGPAGGQRSFIPSDGFKPLPSPRHRRIVQSRVPCTGLASPQLQWQICWKCVQAVRRELGMRREPGMRAGCYARTNIAISRSSAALQLRTDAPAPAGNPGSLANFTAGSR